MGGFVTRYALYLLRWQCSTPILAPMIGWRRRWRILWVARFFLCASDVVFLHFSRRPSKAHSVGEVR